MESAVTAVEMSGMRRIFWRWYAHQDPETVVLRRRILLVVVKIRIRDVGEAFSALFGAPPSPPMA